MFKTYWLSASAKPVIFFCALAPFSLSGQSVQTGVSEAPTSFQTEVRTTNETQELVKKLPSTQLINRGGRGKAQTLYLRGSKTSDIAFTLEGIRLNSVASGDFDLGSFDLFGLESARLIRGGYSPYNSLPAGQLQFFLPREERTRLQLTYGSYQHTQFGLQVPGLSISFDRAENDFRYDDGTQLTKRSSNDSRNVAVRAWKRFENSQVWTQVLVSDQSLPGSTLFPSQGFQQSYDWLSAYQGRHGRLSWDVWANLRLIESGSDFFFTSTKSSYDGFLLRYDQKLSESVFLQHNSGLQWDYFDTNNLDHKTRYSFHYSASFFISPTENILIHPRARVEYVNDLDESFSAHGGLGLRWNLNSDLSLLSNISYISRVPSFFDQYFEGFGVQSNPDLKRQKLLQGDVGYELDPEAFIVRQAFFANRGFDLIRSTQLENGDFQARNFREGVTWGFETELRYEFSSRIRTSAFYVYTNSKINERPEAYQPAHQAQWAPEFDFNRYLSARSDFYFRSATKTRNDELAQSLNKQFDLGLSLFGKRQSWSYDLSAHNLLAWKRIEVEGYPLPQEAHFEIKVSKDF